MPAMATYAQKEVSAAGGVAKSAKGTISYTFGQAFCSDNQATVARMSEGVQQLPCQPSKTLHEFVQCDSIAWQGNTYKVSIDTVVRTFDILGCDSAAHVTLTIYYSDSSQFTEQAEGSYTWDDSIFRTSGHHKRLYSTTNGCDSTVTLHLSLMLDKPMPRILSYDYQSVFLDHYPNGNDNPSVSYAAYRWLHDDEAIPNSNTDFYSIRYGSGYSTLTGCYTLEVPTDSTLQFWVKSNTICMDYLQIDGVEDTPMALSPNPVAAANPVTVSIPSNILHKESLFIVADLYGRIVYTTIPSQTILTFAAPTTAGAYTCLISTPAGIVSATRLIVK